MVRALSAGKVSSPREGAQISGVRTSLLAKDEDPKQDLSQRLCCFGLSQKLLASVVHTLTCADYFQWSPGTKMAPANAEAKPSRTGRTPVLWLGMWPDVWSPKRGLPHNLCGSCLSQKLLERGTLLHCWWDCKLVQPLWKSLWCFLKKLDLILPEEPSIPLLGIYPEDVPTHMICTH